MLRTVTLIFLSTTFVAAAAVSHADKGTAPAPAAPKSTATPAARADRAPARATPENPDPWAKLCDPGMKWELEPLEGGKRTKKSGHEWPMIRIENTDQRMLGDVKVCRLRWFVVEEGKKPIDFDSKEIDRITQDMLDTPSWEEAQWPMNRARWVAVAPDGLVILVGRGKIGPTDESVLAQLKRHGPTFPGEKSSPEHRTKYLKGGMHRWSFVANRGRIWCYGYQDTACTAEDSTCHAAACFEKTVGLVALYVDSGAKRFPDEFTFYSAVGLPDYTSWKRDLERQDW